MDSKKNNTRVTKNSGITAVELIISISIISLIGFAISTMAKDMFSYSGTLQNSLSAQQDARNILRQFAAELRTASVSSTGTYPIDEASATAFRFYSDTDGDSLKERLRYYVSGTSLKKDVLKPSGNPLQYTGAPTTYTIVSDVTNVASIFSYYDGNYGGTEAALTQPVNIPSIRLVRADITIEHDPNRSPTPIVVTTQVNVRNLKDNL